MHERAFRLLAARGVQPAEVAEHAVRGAMVGDHDAIAMLAHAGSQAMEAGATSSGVRHLRLAVELAGASAPPNLLQALAGALLLVNPVEALEVCQRELD